MADNGNKDILTLLLALYGAILSTYNLVLSLLERRRHIYVTTSMGIDVRTTESTLNLTAVNPGSRTVSLKTCGLLLPDGKQFVSMNAFGDVPPCDLQGGLSCTTYFFLKAIASTLAKSGYPDQVETEAFFRDALSNLYKSKPVTCRIKDGLQG